MLTWIYIGIAVQIAWLIVYYTQIKWVTIQESFDMCKEDPWIVLFELKAIAIDVLIWPITVVNHLRTLYYLDKEGL